jgi:GNAT superfamily N-acetyltransferase
MQEPTIVVMTAGPADRAALVDLLGAQMREHAIATDSLAPAIDAVLADPTLGALLVAHEGARAIGVAYVSYIHSLEHGGRSAWLDELYVAPDRRDRGVGRRLLHAALDLARAQGCRAMDLVVEADHARAANHYAREGFAARTRQRFVKRLP